MINVGLSNTEKHKVCPAIENGKGRHLGRGKNRSARARPSSSDKERKEFFFAALPDLITLGAVDSPCGVDFFFSLDTGICSLTQHP